MSRYIKIVILIGLVSLMTLNSCKDPVSPKANVTVKNGMLDNGIANEAPMEGVTVTVYIDPQTGKPGYVDPDNKTDVLQKKTDAAGKCSFDFNVENILQVRAEFPLNGDTLYGEGVLVLEEDKTVEEVIYMRKYKSQL